MYSKRLFTCRLWRPFPGGCGVWVTDGGGAKTQQARHARLDWRGRGGAYLAPLLFLWRGDGLRLVAPLLGQGLGLNVEVANVEGVFLNKLTTGFHHLAHQCGKHLIRLLGILNADL